MIEVRNVKKEYKNNVVAVKNANLVFEMGRIYGLLGRNGAGKTSLINVITNRLFPTEGEIIINGINAIENDFAQENIFCMTEKGGYPIEMKVLAGFKWAKMFYKDYSLEYALKLAKIFGIDTKKRIKELSTGYSSIFKLINTLASNAQYLIFDEPVLGLDAGMRDLFYKCLIDHYSNNECCIIVSTHLIEEIAKIVDHVVIIDSGEIIINEDTDAVLENAYVVSGPKEVVLKETENKPVIHQEQLGNYLAVTIDAKITKKDQEYFTSVGLEVNRAKLQEIFIRLTSGGNHAS